MPITFDSVMNVVIPLGVVLIFIGILYKSLQKYIDVWFVWIANAFGKMTETVEDKTQSLNFTDGIH